VEGEIRNGPEWNVPNVTAERSVICGMRKVASAQIAERFEPSTVLWAFHTIQPSSVNLYSAASRSKWVQLKLTKHVSD